MEPRPACTFLKQQEEGLRCTAPGATVPRLCDYQSSTAYIAPLSTLTSPKEGGKARGRPREETTGMAAVLVG